MIGLLGTLILAQPVAPPGTLTVMTPRGEARIAVRYDRFGAPVLPAPLLVRALNGTYWLSEPWADVTVARQTFRFLLDAPLYLYQGSVRPLAGNASVTRDTLFIPFQFVAEVLPHMFAERFRYEPDGSRLVETGPSVAAPPPARLPNGLRPGHLVTVDAGHGGIDRGNPGLYLPRGVQEKHVTLQVALLLRGELRERGVGVRMTRIGDTLIALRDRAATCTDVCDLLVSIHVDALDPRRRRDYRSVGGFSTYIIGEENTEDADRVAGMENEALRFEGPESQQAADGSLAFLLRDLQMNELLRESASAAALIQAHLDPVHSGQNRGVMQSNRLAVLNLARRPSVLVEMGYSTNTDDARLLTRRTSQAAIASAIADAVVAYLLEYERKTGSGNR